MRGVSPTTGWYPATRDTARPVAATVADDLCEYHGHDDSLTGSAVELRQQIHGPVEVDTSAPDKAGAEVSEGKGCF
jgi:hypothetical protein